MMIKVRAYNVSLGPRNVLHVEWAAHSSYTCAKIQRTFNACSASCACVAAPTQTKQQKACVNISAHWYQEPRVFALGANQGDSCGAKCAYPLHHLR